ncbi:MAG: NAD(P)-dependent oxidoreductase [Aeromonadaceae bacterium]
MKVAFIGLGVMGYPMAGHLQRQLQEQGEQVCVYNRTGAKAERWVEEFGGHQAVTPAEAAQGAHCVMLCVGNDEDVRSLVYGADGILATLAPGALLIDHTTTSASLAEELAAACASIGAYFLDAPVSGGQAGAQRGALTIMLGGEASVVQQAEPFLACYGTRITHVGPHGAGQRCKMVNQICIAGILQGLSEGLTLARASGLDPATVARVLGGGAAQSWQLDNRALSMAAGEFDFGFAIEWMHKDLGFCLQEAATLGLALPLTQAVDSRYQELMARGFSRCDTSVLIRQFDKP